MHIFRRATNMYRSKCRNLAWLYKVETSSDLCDFSDPQNGDCSDWVTFASDKPAQWKTRVKRAAKMSILSLEALPVSGLLVQPAEMLSWCALVWVD